MKKLVVLLSFFSVFASAQNIQLLTVDSLPIANAIVADLSRDEIIFSDEEGQVNISIFENDQLLQVVHTKFQTILSTKEDLLRQGVVVLQESEGISIGEVDIAVDSRSKETKYELITQSASISKQKIEQQAPATSADMLENTGQVLIQRSQFGGGSPIIRGFEASRVLLVIDGVRMNNAIYRSGHLQNAITMDPNVLEGTEIIFGPNSLIYGSDALGGVIHFKTKDPLLRADSNSVNKLGGFMRYQSASEAVIGNMQMSLGTENWGVFVGVTQSSFQDLRMGNNRSQYGVTGYGLVPYYVDQIDGKDTMLVNNDPSLQRNSGYVQQDGIVKILYQPKKGLRFKLNTQLSNSSDIPRFDKINEYQNGELRYGDWYYGPQKRLLSAFSIETTLPTQLFDESSTVLAFQEIQESRNSRDFGSNLLESQIEDVLVYSINSDFIKYVDSTRSVKLNYGTELLLNTVSSTANITNIETGDKSGFLETRYPGGGSTYQSAALYAAVQKKWKEHVLKGGVRYSVQQISAMFDTNQVVNLLDLSSVRLLNQAITSSVGYVLRKNNSKYYTSLSSAFKAPNIDDFGKIFEKKGDLTIPNAQLKPETSLSGEVGSSYQGRRFEYDMAGFYTRVFEIMTKDFISINGQDSININGESLTLVSNVNNGTADIFGVFAAVRLNLSRSLSISSTATITKAKFIENDDPVPHIPPFYGRTSVDYKSGKMKVSIYSQYNGLKALEDASELTDNPDEGLPGVGNPAWYTLNASMFIYPFNNLRIQLAVQNVMDVHYKTFASGISAPGRNLMATVYFNF